jgi:hypothetical protein
MLEKISDVLELISFDGDTFLRSLAKFETFDMVSGIIEVPCPSNFELSCPLAPDGTGTTGTTDLEEG